jgi:hypothetical protein
MQIHSFIWSFIQQIFIQYLLCSVCGSRDTMMNKTEMVPPLRVEFQHVNVVIFWFLKLSIY